MHFYRTFSLSVIDSGSFDDHESDEPFYASFSFLLRFISFSSCFILQLVFLLLPLYLPPLVLFLEAGIKAAASQAAAAVPSRRPLQALNPLLTLVAEQREVVRAEARREKMTAVLQLSDQLRDEFLPEVGVRLEDREAGQVTLNSTEK